MRNTDCLCFRSIYCIFILKLSCLPWALSIYSIPFFDDTDIIATKEDRYLSIKIASIQRQIYVHSPLLLTEGFRAIYK